ncbi:hypothetical protein GCM10025868_35490 [Angustibacter aerolatus]|uniref:EAL domain-containing protein n=1 Tax=Angustibacter aerolatus TaxID=1162965 RepID=A0ABQ6JLT8_9ACTN|nr:hypothetical protein GCM10025868_35490 [Angustibacter aerolatus]
MSVGVAHWTEGVDADALMHRADAAMYAAKAQGKNRVQVFTTEPPSSEQQAAFEQSVVEAVETDAVQVLFQPVLSADGRCSAVESVLRWQHPTRGPLEASAFLPVVDQVGLGHRLLTLVLRTAGGLAQEHLRRTGRRVAVHVPLTAGRLTDPRCVDLVRDAVADHDLEPRRLVLEVTESAVTDRPTVLETLQALRAAGAGLALDEFGAGYAALATLQSLPVDLLKVDRSFVDGCPDSVTDRSIVAAMTGIARRLGLATVAEGVERVEQARLPARRRRRRQRGSAAPPPHPRRRRPRLARRPRGRRAARRRALTLSGSRLPRGSARGPSRAGRAG